MSKQDDLYAKPLAESSDFRFDERVVRVFPDMINRSVPGYNLVIPMIGLLARHFVTPGSHVYDLGCSLGACSLAIRQALSEQNVEIIAVDNSDAMVTRCRQIMAEDKSAIPVTVRKGNICDLPIHDASMVVLNFTLQFVPPDEREALLEKIFNGMRPGGALVLSEKVCFADSQQQELFTTWHHDFKRTQGYSDLEIAQKRNALENTMIPETPTTHFDRLSAIGFQKVHNWYQCFNFFSIIAIRAR